MFSIIVYVDNYERFKNCINSIVKQNYNFDKVELIIEDVTKTNEVEKYLESININYIYNKKKNGKLSNLYNDGLSKATGTYVTFINSSISYDDGNIFSSVEKLDYDIIALYVNYHDLDSDKVNRYKMQPGEEQLIDLEKTPFRLHTFLEGYFIKKEIIKNDFCSLDVECRFNFILDLIEDNPCYYFSQLSITNVEPAENIVSKNSVQYELDWYISSLEYYLKKTKKKYKKEIPLYVQEYIMYIIYSKYNCNINDRNKGVLDEKLLNEFTSVMTDILVNFNDLIILQPSNEDGSNDHQFRIPRWLRKTLFNAKMDKLKLNKKIVIENDVIYIEVIKNEKVISKVKINDIDKENVTVLAINYKNNKLYFDCTTTLSNFMDEDEIKVYCMYNKKKVNIKQNHCYNLIKAFGKTYNHKYSFSFNIDVLPQNINKLEMYTTIAGKEIKLNFNYSKVQAHLSNSKRSFWHYKNFVLYNKHNCIIMKKYNFFEVLLSEIMFDLSKLKNVKNKKRVIKLEALRMLYYITKPFYKNKHIWITFDKLYKAGDNGEYLYQYGNKHNHNIYYLIKKDAPDYERLVKQDKKHILVFNSLKAKLFALHSEVILKTHANAISYCGFDGISRNFVSGFFNPEIIEVQHGLTIQEIAQYQNRLYDNIKHYCCASEFEVKNILKPIYDFDESYISMTGLARYDGLKSNDKRTILITPTWRKNLAKTNSRFGNYRDHNDNFKHSEYFKIYNSLINNKELIDCAKKNNYKIIYLLHPCTSSQLCDFDKNESVELIPATGNMNYEKILTESSLMVTDYSGVQFDFAYQRKVLVYYHPDKLPPHYEEGGLDYDKMGFGPICKDEKEIVKELCYYMENDCKIKEKYKKRADKFFAFDDYDNCHRIIDAVDEYLDSIK